MKRRIIKKLITTCIQCKDCIVKEGDAAQLLTPREYTYYGDHYGGDIYYLIPSFDYINLRESAVGSNICLSCDRYNR